MVSMAVLAALLVGGCGGSAGGTTSDSIRVVAIEFQYSPSLWRVPANQEIPLRFINEGSILHEWVILSQPIADDDEFIEDSVVFTATAEASTTTEATVPPLDAGEYQVVCVIPGHFAAGMKGTLRVAAP
jgi:plastocyanin